MRAPQRVAFATRQDEFKLLQKPWQGILLLALHEVEAPGADEDEDDGPALPARAPRGARARRGRRGGRSSGSPLDHLPNVEDVLSDDTFSAAFGFAVLTARKTLDADAWDEAHDAAVQERLDLCLGDGVHPVWADVARRCPVLAQMSGFPEAEPSEAVAAVDAMDLALADISGEDSEELLALVLAAQPLVVDAAPKVALNTLIPQLKARKSISLDPALLELEGSLSAVAVVVAQSLGQPLPEASLAALAAEDEDLAEKHRDLAALRAGEVADWNLSRAAGTETSLDRMRQRLAWMQPDELAADLDASTLQEGLALLEAASAPGPVVDRVRWWHLGALVSEGQQADAIASLTSLSVDGEVDAVSLGDLVVSIDAVEATDWLAGVCERMEAPARLHIALHDALPALPRMTAFRSLQDGGFAFSGEDVARLVPVLLEGQEIRRLSRLLIEGAHADHHPWLVTLCAHLLAARKDIDLYHGVRSARQTLLPLLHESVPPAAFGPKTASLIQLLEGGDAPEDLFQDIVHTKQGLLAYKQIRRALLEGGDGVVESKVLDEFEEALGEGNLNPIDDGLAHAITATLRLNSAIQQVQNGTSNAQTVSLIDGLVGGDNVPTRRIHAIRQLLFDHDLPLPSLVAWYQEHDPRSPWSVVARAALASSEGQHLRAAQEYGRAAKQQGAVDAPEDNEFAFDFEHRVALNRKSLIHYAFSGEWKRAIDLVNEEPGLRTAMTERFLLYLRVSHTAHNGATDDATHIIREAVKEREVVIEENEEGEERERTRIWYNEDQLDILLAYPDAHAIPLPKHPFIGRVMAAKNLSSQRRSHRRNHDQRYAQLMDSSPTPEEVYELARRASDDHALTGLMFLERALSSKQFRLMQQRQIENSMRSLFIMKRDHIAVADRRHLRHLKLAPLILVDTNVLVDALLDRLIQRTGRSMRAGLAIDANRDLHHHLERLGASGKVQLMLPEPVRHELTSIAKGGNVLRDRLRDTFATPEDIEAILDDANVEDALNEVLISFETWTKREERYDAEAMEDERVAKLDAFLAGHSDVYDEVTAMKRLRGQPQRTSLGSSRDIYPEKEDREIMCLAMRLAEIPLEDFGAVLVATRDSDFTLVAPSLLENLGFGVIKNAQTLNQWSAR
jgi:hypothetical protein